VSRGLSGISFMPVADHDPCLWYQSSMYRSSPPPPQKPGKLQALLVARQRIMDKRARGIQCILLDTPSSPPPASSSPMWLSSSPPRHNAKISRFIEGEAAQSGQQDRLSDSDKQEDDSVDYYDLGDPFIDDSDKDYHSSDTEGSSITMKQEDGRGADMDVDAAPSGRQRRHIRLAVLGIV